MSATPELEQIAILAEIDDLLDRVRRWVDQGPAWETGRTARHLVGRVVSRAQSLRIRLETPLVVATFGGTGTGKSTLVNALAGQDVTETGRQRPTTTTPILLLHPDVEPQALGLDLSQFHVRTIDVPVLRDIVLIDCPDPDTSETGDTGTNLAMLRGIVPHSDVLIYTSTQQKYRSARVVDELADIAGGCRMVFVQTHADLDADIRDDWKQCLSAVWNVPEMFFVDSQQAFAEQQQGQRPGGDFGRLLDLLTNQLGASRRLAIRRANIADLLEEALEVCHQDYAAALPAVTELQAALDQQRGQLRETLIGQLRSELLLNCSLWERRLLSAVTDMWGFSPFSAVLRLYNGLGALIASFTFFRARTSAQMALIGAVQGARWLKTRAAEQDADVSLDRLATFGISDQQLQEARMIVSGYVHSAGIEDQGIEEQRRDLNVLRRQAASVEGEFLLDARQGVDQLIEELAVAHGGRWTRLKYEVLFLLYLVFVLGRVGHNFFWSSFLAPLLQPGTKPQPLLAVDFYVPATIFLLIWSGLLVLCFTLSLRRGLTQRINDLATSMADHRLLNGLFPSLENSCRQIVEDQLQLARMAERVRLFRRRLASAASFLGGRQQPSLTTGV